MPHRCACAHIDCRNALAARVLKINTAGEAVTAEMQHLRALRRAQRDHVWVRKTYLESHYAFRRGNRGVKDPKFRFNSYFGAG